jgi:phosphate-selective porin OprO and OprP
MRSGTRAAALAWLTVVLWLGPTASAQSPAVPSSEDRIKALEAQNQELLRQLAEIRQQLGMPRPLPADPAPVPPASAPPVVPPAVLTLPPAVPAVPPEAVPAGVPTALDESDPLAGVVSLDDGLHVRSRDGKYKFEFHNLTQVEGRFFQPAGDPLTNSFDIPRQRLYFQGSAGENYDIYTVLNRGYGSLDVLDAYIDFKFDKSFTVRVGRTKTPFSYEYVTVPETDLIAPERSVFVGNLSTNRQIGLMAYGHVWDERLSYKAGLFNGPHNSFQDFNNFKTPFLYADAQPFLHGDSDLVRHLHFVGAGHYGRQDNALDPPALRTANDETATASVAQLSPTFLTFNPNATEFGETSFWSGELVWYYKAFNLFAEYNGGFTTYSVNNGTPTVRVPFEGFSVMTTYFLTGEHITRRNNVTPRRAFDIKNPRSNPGAIELYARTAYLHAGGKVFTNGLVDPKLWSNEATVLDIGVNWFLSRYVRIWLDWQYSRFGSPVQVGPNRFTNSENLYWVRTQLFY